MTSSLNVRLLVTKVQKIADWFMLEVHLGVPNEELNKIDQRFSVSHGVERCKAELFDLWLRRNPSARWDDVASALEQLNEKALASELRALCRISSPVLPCACLVTPVPVDEQTQVQGTVRVLELGKSTVRKFTRLESKFASLVCNLKTTTEKKGIRPERLHSFLEVRLNQKIEFFSSTTVSDLFESITPYYCFLNTTLLENIIDEFLGEPLQQQLDEYEGLLEDFTPSTKISLLKEIDMKTVAKHKGMPLVVLKLAGRCLDVTIKRFQELVRYIFGKESSVLSNIQVEDGCICITWNTRESVVPSLTALANEKLQFMKLVGILRLTVGEVTIFEQPGTGEEWEEDNSSLEDHLVQSVTSGCTEAVEFLLKVGADPSHRNAIGTSVLGLASETGSTKKAKLLIDTGASINSSSPKMTPLMLACKEGHEDTVHLLLQSGADPNLQTDTGLTALLSVDYNDCRSLAIVRSLLEAGAAVNTQNSKGWSSLAAACKYSCYKIAELLIQYGADVQLSTVNRYTPLMIACQAKHDDIAALLLKSHADPNLQNNKNQTALMLACKMQLAKTVSLLLSSGADPNLQNDFGRTALMYSLAVSSHELDDCIPVLLISAGANPNIQSKAGFTALMVAGCNESGMEILLNAQADMNAQDQAGYTALHRLASFGNLTTVELLLSAGADPLIINSNGKTAVDVALDCQQHDICQLLLSYTTTKSAETTPQQQVDPLRDATSSSSASTTPHPELDQLRIAVRHPLPPAGTIKHDAVDLEDIEEEYIYHK